MLRQYDSVRTITKHPEFDHITMSIMMVLDYLNEALKKKGESSDNNGSFLYYEDVLKKLSTEVKS